MRRTIKRSELSQSDVSRLLWNVYVEGLVLGGGAFMAYFSRLGAYREVRLFDECLRGGGLSDSLVPSIVKYK